MKAKFKFSDIEQFIKEVKELAQKYKLDIEGVGIIHRDFIKFDNSNERMFMSFTPKKNGTKS